MQMICNPIFPARQVRLASTEKPITPFGGLVSLIVFFEKIGWAGRISELMPFAYTSPNAIPPAIFSRTLCSLFSKHSAFPTSLSPI